MRTWTDKYLEVDSTLKNVNKRIHKIYNIIEKIDKYIEQERFRQEKTDDQ